MSERNYLISKASRAVAGGKLLTVANPHAWHANPKFKHLVGDKSITHVDEKAGHMVRNGMRYNAFSGARLGA